tara:strand:- start:723 stop:1526 length:804 start_codon:yes stop_codon:yes gene_type:complete
MNKNQIKLGIIGAGGKMGRGITEFALKDPDFTNIQLFENPEYPNEKLEVYDRSNNSMATFNLLKDLNNSKEQLDVLIDFSLPDSTETSLNYAAKNRIPLVIGTTGIEFLQEKIEKASQKTALLISPNMSLGVNLCFKLAGLAAKALGDTYDIDIMEAHHRGKRDAPSGTALKFGSVISENRDDKLLDNAVYGRVGSDSAREDNSIGFQTIRAGDTVGDHTVFFAGEGERIEITHRATSRTSFVTGALKAAKWLITRDNGLYSFNDII